MPQENVGVIERAAEHWNETGELPLFLYDREVTFTTRGELAGSTTYRGHEGLERRWRPSRACGHAFQIELLEFVQGDEVVVAQTRFHLRSRTGVDLDVDEGWTYWFREGKIGRVEQHGSKKDALEAAGLAD